MKIIKKVLRRVYFLYCRAGKTVASYQQGVSLKKGVTFLGLPIITLMADSTLEIGQRTVLVSTSMVADLGVINPVILRTVRPHAHISIGDDAGLTGTVICAAKSVTVGRHCLIGSDVIIADNDFHPVTAPNRRYERDPDRIGAKPVVIGDNVFIGARSVILKGVHIGDNAVIGAGSVVTHDIPANTIAAGNPARVVAGVPPIRSLSMLRDTGMPSFDDLAGLQPIVVASASAGAQTTH